MCLRGVRELKSKWLEQTGSDQIEVHVVWSPQLGAKERHVPDGAALMPDPRVRHYWDPDRVVGRRYAEILGLDSPAWDVWLLFGRDAAWEDSTKRPRRQPSWTVRGKLGTERFGAQSLHASPEAKRWT